MSVTKVVVFFTTNPTKLVLQFSEFSTIFYTFYKFLQICNTIEDVLLRRDPYNFSKSHSYTPRLHKTPQIDLGACNATFGRGGRRSSGQFRRAGGTPRLASGRARLGAHLGHRGGRGLRGGSPTRTRGGGRRWRPRRLGVTARRTLGWAIRDTGRCNRS
jgi:hypothetical protein